MYQLCPADLIALWHTLVVDVAIAVRVNCFQDVKEKGVGVLESLFSSALRMVL